MSPIRVSLTEGEGRGLDYVKLYFLLLFSFFQIVPPMPGPMDPEGSYKVTPPIPVHGGAVQNDKATLTESRHYTTLTSTKPLDSVYYGTIAVPPQTGK